MVDPRSGEAKMGPSIGLVRRIRASKSMLLGLAILGVLLIVLVPAELTMPHDPLALAPVDRLHPPSDTYLLGADAQGRDVLSRLIHGGRTSLLIGAGSITLSVLIGVTTGVIAGYIGGFVDTVLMRVADFVLSVPILFFLIGLAAVLGPSLLNTTLILALAGWPVFARLARGSAASLKARPFVAGSIIAGLSRSQIIRRHIIPNAMPEVLVLISIRMAWAIQTESALSFLGLGVPPPYPSWGTMLSDALDTSFEAPSLIVYPAVAIFIVLLAFNLIGDGIRDLLDPRLKLGGK